MPILIRLAAIAIPALLHEIFDWLRMAPELDKRARREKTENKKAAVRAKGHLGTK